MLWTTSLILSILWLLGLVLDKGGLWIHALPAVIGVLLFYRLTAGSIRR